MIITKNSPHLPTSNRSTRLIYKQIVVQIPDAFSPFPFCSNVHYIVIFLKNTRIQLLLVCAELVEIR